MLRKPSSSDVLGLAAAVSSLKLSPAQKSAAKKNSGKKKTKVEEPQEDLGSAQEDESQAESPVSYEQPESDEDINKKNRLEEARSGKPTRKKKQPKTAKDVKPKGKPQPKRKSTGAKGSTEEEKKPKAKKGKSDPVETAEKKNKKPCMESFLAKEWIKVRDEKLKELKGTKPYRALLTDISVMCPGFDSEQK